MIRGTCARSAIIIIVCTVSACAPPASAHAPSAERFHAAVEAWAERLPPGSAVATAVVDERGTQFYIGRSPGSRATIDSIFEVGSLTKPLLATALASMNASGRVHLGEPLSDFDLPSPSFNGREITLLDLATHSSGLPREPGSLRPSNLHDPYNGFDSLELREFLSQYRLERSPGTVYEYSNLGAAVLGAALARRDRSTFEGVLRDRVFRPLAMRDSGLTDGPAPLSGHLVDGEEVAAWRMSAMSPAGGVRSTVRDMAKFVRCNLGIGALGPLCQAAQQTRRTFGEVSVGLFWFRDRESHVVWDDGDTEGFHAAVALDPYAHRGVVILANGGWSVHSLARFALDEDAAVAFPVFARSSDRKRLHRDTNRIPNANVTSFSGRYFADGNTLDVAASSSGLSVGPPGAPALRLSAAGRDTFIAPLAETRVHFLRGADGRVTGFELRQNGIVLHGSRVLPPSGKNKVPK